MSLYTLTQAARQEGPIDEIEVIISKLSTHLREKIQHLRATATGYQFYVLVNANELDISELQVRNGTTDRQLLSEACTRFQAHYPTWEGMEVHLHTNRKYPQVVVDWSEAKEGEGARIRASFDQYRSSVHLDEQQQIVDRGVTALWRQYDQYKTESVDSPGRFHQTARAGVERCDLTSSHFIHRGELEEDQPVRIPGVFKVKEDKSANTRWYPTEILRAFLATVPDRWIEERIYLENGFLWVDWSAPPEEEFVTIDSPVGSVI